MYGLYDRTIFVNLESEDAKNLNIEKIIFKVVQINSQQCTLLIKNQVLYIYGKNLLNIFMEHDLNILMLFGIKENL